MTEIKKVCIVGSGNWGSVIAKIVGNNVLENESFDNSVPMYVYEETVDGKKLTEIINTQHENVKYLPGHKLPENVVAIPDVKEAVKGADILVFVVPHQFVKGICTQIKGHLKDGAIAVSLIKGTYVERGLDITDKGLDLISNLIRNSLDIPCAVLMGANIASEVANENFCEATIGCKDEKLSILLKEVFQTPYFRVSYVTDEETVELCGALKNVVAVGAGFITGCGFGDNTKAAVIRLGLMEMVQFCKQFYGNADIGTFLESCGVADLVTTCYSGRNMRVAKAFVGSGKTIEQLEAEMLNGQKLQGPPTAAEVNVMLKAKGMEDRFPLFTAIHRICIGELEVEKFIGCLKEHPEHMTNEEKARL